MPNTGETTDRTKHFTTKYSQSWKAALQQTQSRFKTKVEIMTGLKGNSKVRIDIFGKSNLIPRETRKGDTPDNETKTALRWLKFRAFHQAEVLDPNENLQESLSDARLTKIQENYKAAAERAIDKAIVTHAIGVAFDGEAGGDSVYLPEEQVIAKNFVMSGTAQESSLTYEKILRARTKLLKSEAISAGDTLVLAISPDELEALLQDKQLTSSDYNNVKAIINGEMDKLLGFEIIVSNQIPVVDGVRQCCAWVKKALTLGYWEESSMKISERDDKCFAPQIYYSCAFDVRRVYDDAVVRIDCVTVEASSSYEG